jgi:hypothetical protein
MAGTLGCPAGHPMPSGPGRICPACRRDQVIARVAAVETSLSAQATALESGPDALSRAAPPAVGRLVTELIARGSTSVSAPRCVVCGRTGLALTRTDDGGGVQAVRGPPQRGGLHLLRCRQAGRWADR